MKHPNRLAEFMAKTQPHQIDDPTLASAVRTVKQQIWKLRTGRARMTSKWAARLAPHLNCQWPELMDPDSPEAAAFRATRTDVVLPSILEAIGRRVAWGRTYRAYTIGVAADRFDIPADRLAAIEGGREAMTIFEVITIATKLQLTADFLLRGSIESLPFIVAEDFRAAIANISGSPPDTA